MKKYIFSVCFWAVFYGFLFAQTPAWWQNKLLEDLQILASAEMEGRRTDTPGAAKARQFIKQRFIEIGLKPAFGQSYEQPFSFHIFLAGQKRGVNIAGIVEGKESDLWIVISAHYDHLGKSGNTIYYGADDNASGVAALLSLANLFTKQPPRHNMLFLATDAEEIGLQGAKYFVEHLPFPLEKLALNVNLDMVSRSDSNQLIACGTYHYPVLKHILQQCQPEDLHLVFGHDYPQKGAKSTDWTNASDHAAFHQQGVPFIYFGVEDHQDYHTPTDTVERIQPHFFRAAVETIARGIILLDQHLDDVCQSKQSRR
ncbi:MAG: M28 family peptidase [Cytophagales bacterium]|nr:M28 family peptidase [Bernardetiaceae bacterium]MDW8211286.1 M28 family peptidase [Cytophagales bacterium]